MRYHARRLNRYLLTLGYLLGGIGVAPVGPWVVMVWAAVGGLGFLALWYRQRRLRSAAYVATDWLLGAIGIIGGFIVGGGPVDPPPPQVERLHPPGAPS
jgi:hypothetical protein